MTKEDIELLLKDLCARLPYGVKVSTNRGPELVEGLWPFGFHQMKIEGNFDWWFLDFKPYLRPMSSMTEEEIKELLDIDKKRWIFSSRHLTWHLDGEVIDYLNKKMFDWRELIPKGLALEAPEGMYH